VRYVEQHFREPLTLAQVAAVAHLSPHWFSEQFRRTTGDTFQSYLRRRRLQFARALLDSTDVGVTEVCRAAGFNDPSYFGRAFREQYGEPPSARGIRGRERMSRL
jgi:AraC-like DNA-binding protein